MLTAGGDHRGIEEAAGYAVPGRALGLGVPNTY
jgi:hypothetical protein